MELISSSFSNKSVIPHEFAFAKPDSTSHITLSDNRNPHLSWSDVPAKTASFALICHDPDVPSQGDQVNQEGMTVPATLPRVDFYHWVLVDIPGQVREIAAGSHSQAVTPRGKASQAPLGRHGINDYTTWFNGDTEMGGDYYGYDGPCPPWNDEIKHHYVFTLYALDCQNLVLPARFNGQEALAALKKHVLAEASITGIYSLNPAVKI